MMKNKENNTLYESLIPIIITIFIAFGGNYLITTNKLSATDAKVEIYQQQIDGLSKKMDKLNDSQFFVSSQIALIQNLTKGYEYDEVKVIGILMANAITESVMNLLWSKDVEQKLINDYYASQIGILDTSYADKYKSFLTERNRIKEQINSDFDKYNKEVLS